MHVFSDNMVPGLAVVSQYAIKTLRSRWQGRLLYHPATIKNVLRFLLHLLRNRTRYNENLMRRLVLC